MELIKKCGNIFAKLILCFFVLLIVAIIVPAFANNFFLLSVDADPKVRYSRIVARKSETDNVSYEEFLKQERIEMNNNEKFKQNLHVCAKEADFQNTKLV